MPEILISKSIVVVVLYTVSSSFLHRMSDSRSICTYYHNTCFLQAWKNILRSFKVCPGFTLQHFESYATLIDASLDCIDLAQIMELSIFEGEGMFYTDLSDMAFSLKVSHFSFLNLCHLYVLYIPVSR